MRTDIKKDRKDLYLPEKADFTEVDVPAMTYLAVDGHGDPNTSPAYATAIQALYAGAYAIRAVLKKRTGDDFVVGPLEGLWASADNAAFVAGDKGEWDWTMMIPLPEAVSSQDIAEGLAQAARKKPDLPVSALKEAPPDRGQVAADPPRGHLRRRGPHPGPPPRRGHATPRTHLERSPSRDLPQ